MHLLNPYAIAWLPLIALLLLVARRRRPRPRRAVSNLYLWRQTTPLDPTRLALAQFRRHRLLALQIAFMLAVIAALARPIVTGREHAAAATPQPPPAAAPASPRAGVEPIHVLLLTQGNFFLEQSLVTNPLVAVDRERRAGSRYDVIVCDACGDAPSDDAGLLTIPATDETPAAAERMTISDADHPIGAALAALGGGPVLASPAARSSDTVIGGDVVLRAGGVPLLVVTESAPPAAQGGRTPYPTPYPTPHPTPGGGGRTAVLNVNLGSSTLPLSTAFPVLMASTVDWLARRDPSSEPLNRATATEVTGQADRATESPDGLWRALLLVGLALLLIEWRYWSAQERTRPALVCRGIVIALTALAAAGVELPFGDASQAVIFALDRSGSLPADTQAAALTRVNAMTHRMRTGDRAGVVAFGLDAAVERAATGRPRVDAIVSTISPAGTNIEAALRAARLALPQAGARRIVLVSDGRATAGDASREIARAAAEGIPIDTVAADAAPADRPLIVKSVGAPTDVRVGEPFVVSAEIAGPPGAHSRVTLSRDNQPAVEQDVEVAADGTANVTFTDQRSQAGVYAYHAVLGDDETAAGVMVSVAGSPQILHVGSSAGPLVGLLMSSGFLVRQVAPGALPSIAGELARFDAIVLDDVPADRLASTSTEAIANYVGQSGGGLLLLGGPQSLDAAGYPEGPLARLLPVDLRPRGGQRSPAMGLVVAFDKSGSMADLVSGVAKIELARQAVRKVLDAVRPTDPIGVVAFDAAPVIVSPLAAAPDPQRLSEALRAIDPGGSTAIAPALMQAADWLRRARVTRRHVLLVSDGRTAPADAERLRAIVRDGGFELSVIAIGGDADRRFLEELASGTGGRAYFPDDLRQLPVLAAREAARASGGGIVQEPFAVRAAEHAITVGLDRAGLPTMAGYVVSAARPGAETVLLSHLDDPILAAWRFGLGRVAVYTADLRSPWSAGLRRWTGFSPLWLQTAQWLARPATDRALRASIVERSDGAHLVVEGDTPSGDPLEADVRATVRGPDAKEQDVTLTSAVRGRYEAPLATPTPGRYVVSIDARGAAGDARILRGFYWSANRERRATGADLATLTQIAAATGGRLFGPTDDPFSGPRPRAFQEIWTLLAAAALLLFLVDVAVRRGVTFRRRAAALEPRVASEAAA
jgi:Mg-chelatase subunit ChlD